MDKEKMFEAIKSKVGDKLTDEQINGIVEKFNLENGKAPEIIISSDPYEFENKTRQRKDIYEHSWAGSKENIVNTDILIGDYKPGIDDKYKYSENGNNTIREKYEMSDFSVNQIQVAVVMEEYSNHYRDNDIDEYSEKIQIYLPDEKEYTGEISFKKIVLEERKKDLIKQIKEKVRDKLTDEQINGIVEKFNLENGKAPEIIISSDPYEFEKKTRQRKDIYEHSWAGSTEDIVNTDVLIGDYKPGIDDIYEYSQNGDSRTPDEKHEMSDFSVNQIQVAVVMEEYSDHFNGSDIDEYSEKIQIYLPDEKEYTGEISFKKIILDKRKQNLTNEIRNRVNGRLTDEQINGIAEKFNFENEKIPEIVISSDPYEFEKKTRQRKDIYEHSWAGSTEDIVNTDVLIGDYKPGIDDIYEYSQNGDSEEPDEKHEMSDFSVNQIQVAVVMEEYSDHFNGSDIDEYSEKIQIYLPDEKEYPENLSFAKLLENSKSKLEKKEQQLTDLENEEKKITEAEALINKQKEGQDIGEE